MTQQDSCEGCSRKDRCRQVYRRLSSSPSASIAAKVVLAFVLPLGIFIAVLAVAQLALVDAIKSELLLQVVGFLFGLAAVGLYVIAVKLINRRLSSGV